jgi:hypothetical protein
MVSNYNFHNIPIAKNLLICELQSYEMHLFYYVNLILFKLKLGTYYVDIYNLIFLEIFCLFSETMYTLGTANLGPKHRLYGRLVCLKII